MMEQFDVAVSGDKCGKPAKYYVYCDLTTNIYDAISGANWFHRTIQAPVDASPKLLHQLALHSLGIREDGVMHKSRDYSWYGVTDESRKMHLFKGNHSIIIDRSDRALDPKQLQNCSRLFSDLTEFDLYVPGSKCPMRMTKEWAEHPLQLAALEQVFESWGPEAPFYLRRYPTKDDNVFPAMDLINFTNGLIDARVQFGKLSLTLGVLGDPYKYGEFEYADPECFDKLLAAVSRVERSPDGDLQRSLQCREDADLRKVAKDLVNGKAFGSDQVRPDMLHSVFMIMVFMEREYVLRLLDSGMDLMYEYYSDASPRSVNGQPSFFSMRAFNRWDSVKVRRYCKEFVALMEEFESGS